ncbi:MAG: heme o synthase [Phycisphaerales bacterium]|nr:heme o synthase [Phycisphaerales bacterium]
MSRADPLSSTPLSDAGVAARLGPLFSAQTAQALNELSKPRITRLVTITAGVGFALGAIGQSWSTSDFLLRALACLIGTALSSAGANALNMWWERARDARMDRTAHRPLPDGRLSPGVALGAGLALSLLGVLTLLLIGPAPALVSLATIVTYVLVYTPMKPLTRWNTLVGAVPGALPPVIGWAAAASGNHLSLGLESLLTPAAWALFILMFVWQIPHFMAIAWMYREDYARGGYRMLPLNDPTGRLTFATILVWSIALVPATIAPVMLLEGRLGIISLVAAALSGAAFVGLCFRLYRTHERAHARAVFLASIMHLPLLLMVMVADACWRAFGR